MAKVKKQYCFNCGEYLGEYPEVYGDIEACGESECQRELNNAYRERDEETQERAKDDDYNRYR